MVNPNTGKPWVWHPAITKWRDQTGTAHILNRVSGNPVCDARPFTFGGGSENIADTGANKCRSCEAYAKRRSKP